MVPLIELRGSILYATGIGLPFLPAHITAIIGNMLLVPFIFLFARKILVWELISRSSADFSVFALRKARRAARSFRRRQAEVCLWRFLLFVGIPLPGTGAWTWNLAASLLDMDFKSSVVAVMCGVPWQVLSWSRRWTFWRALAH